MRKGFRGSLFHSVSDPWTLSGDEHRSAEFFPDGVLITENGKVKAIGDFKDLKSRYPNLEIEDFSGKLIIPGFVDGHIHFPQVRVLGSYGEKLLSWLQKWVFPEEAKYRDPEYAALGAREFFDDLLSAGTTTCQVFTTAAPTATEALFREALERNVRVISGLTGMDRLAPPDACISPHAFLKESTRLIEEFHETGRLLYAITPRYALGSSRELLLACGELKERFPDCWINTHLSETLQECSEVAKAFPEFRDYLAVYEAFGLVGEKFTGGHGIWLSESELVRLHQNGSALSFCPCSNLYLGSGLFPLGRVTDPERRVRFSIGSDIGGGNRFCMLPVLDEAYKVGMLNYTQILFDHPSDPDKWAEAQRNRLSPYKALYASTLGGAEALRIDHLVGNFEPGKEADFVVLDWNGGQRALLWRQSSKIEGASPKDIHEAAELFFGLVAAGDDRAIQATYLMANCAWQR